MNDGFWLSAVICLVSLAGLAWMAYGLPRVRQLAELPDALPPRPPSVSVIVAALDEEATIEPALRSLLTLAYPDLQIVAINDRSTDTTGAIMDRLAAQDPRLTVIHVAQLPAGWLGKNHALHLGAAAARGDFLLFTDADVVFEPSALRRAVTHCLAHRLQHLAVFMHIVARSALLQSMMVATKAFLCLRFPPWLVRRSRRVYIGCGAFNLVRADAYRQAGGHVPLRLTVLDDVMLGKLMKEHGFAADALFGRHSVMVEWYRDAADMVKGLEKNSYAMFNYSIVHAAVATAAMAIGHYWPMIGLFVTSGAAWTLNAVALLAELLIFLLVMRTTPYGWRCVLAWPLTSALMIWVMWRGTLITIRRGGVSWRGTLYPLDDLRRAYGG